MHRQQFVNQYVAFGVSEDANMVRMAGGDVTVAWIDSMTGMANAVDYFLESYSQVYIMNQGKLPSFAMILSGINENTCCVQINFRGFISSRPEFQMQKIFKGGGGGRWWANMSHIYYTGNLI